MEAHPQGQHPRRGSAALLRASFPLPTFPCPVYPLLSSFNSFRHLFTSCPLPPHKQVTESAHTAWGPYMKKQLRPDFGEARGSDAPLWPGPSWCSGCRSRPSRSPSRPRPVSSPHRPSQPCLNAFHLCFSFAWDPFPTHPDLKNSHSEEEERSENYFSK